MENLKKKKVPKIVRTVEHMKKKYIFAGETHLDQR